VNEILEPRYRNSNPDHKPLNEGWTSSFEEWILCCFWVITEDIEALKL